MKHWAMHAVDKMGLTKLACVLCGTVTGDLISVFKGQITNSCKRLAKLKYHWSHKKSDMKPHAPANVLFFYSQTGKGTVVTLSANKKFSHTPCLHFPLLCICALSCLRV